jgi:hypothetical protein
MLICSWVLPWGPGALLAVGILNCGVQHENDPAYALLYDFVDKPDATVRIGAIMGLGLAYAGTRKEEVTAFPLSGRALLHLPILLEPLPAQHSSACHDM